VISLVIHSSFTSSGSVTTVGYVAGMFGASQKPMSGLFGEQQYTSGISLFGDSAATPPFQAQTSQPQQISIFGGTASLSSSYSYRPSSTRTNPKAFDVSILHKFQTPKPRGTPSTIEVAVVAWHIDCIYDPLSDLSAEQWEPALWAVPARRAHLPTSERNRI
jgi:hypothetical protein